MITRHPLDVIEVKTPCEVGWEQMPGSAQQRYCDHCDRHVHDLSAMTLDEAEALICREAGHLCVRFTRLTDGRIKTLDYRPAIGRRGYGWRLWTFIGCVGAAMAGAWTLFRQPPANVGGTTMMGVVSMPVTPPGGVQNPPQSPAEPCPKP